MSVFRRKRAGAKGKVKPDGSWTVELRDHNDILRRFPGFTDKAASLELERHLKRLIALRMAGAGPDAELSRFLESCPEIVSNRLAEWGIISSQRAAGGKRITEHIAEWQLDLKARTNTSKHVKETTTKAGKVCNECGWQMLSDIAATALHRWIAEQKTAGRAVATINHHIRAVKSFCIWLAKERRISENPLAFVALLNAKTDRRYERHPYTVEELGKLLAAAETGPIVHGMMGFDRVLLYRTAVETGFRWTELRSLTRASFDFQGEQASVTVKAEDAKNGVEATLPLRPELAADLKARMALFLHDARAFPGMWADKGAEMIRVDLEAAGILSRDASGKLVIVDEYGLAYDFHGLRHTFATLGAKSGIPLVVMQKLMRHSDPKLTAGVYTHILLNDKADELAKLPAIEPTPSNAAIAKTGTDDTTEPPESPAPKTRKKRDRKPDSRDRDVDGQIRTYKDKGQSENVATASSLKKDNPLQNSGLDIGSPGWIRTSDLRINR